MPRRQRLESFYAQLFMDNGRRSAWIGDAKRLVYCVALDGTRLCREPNLDLDGNFSRFNRDIGRSSGREFSRRSRNDRVDQLPRAFGKWSFDISRRRGNRSALIESKSSGQWID